MGACKKENSSLNTRPRCSCKSTYENLTSSYKGYVPTLIIPNGDRINDVLIIRVDSFYSEYFRERFYE